MNLEPYYFSIAISLHALAAMVWVGGMFFAYMALRPVAAKILEPAVRLALWSRTLTRFFVLGMACRYCNSCHWLLDDLLGI